MRYDRRRFATGGIVILLCIAVNMTATAAPLDDLLARFRQIIHVGGGGGTGDRAPGIVTTLAVTGSNAHHYGADLHCADCHIMHASKDTGVFGGPMPNPPGFPVMLRAATATELCLTCHDGVAGIPDVVGADTNGLTDRAAGYFADVEVLSDNGHNLGVAPGSLCMRCHFGPPEPWQTAQVTCVDCHDPHGNGRPRNLQWVSDPAGTPQLGLMVNPAASGLARYEAANVSYATDGAVTQREVTNICIDCHHTWSGVHYTTVGGTGISPFMKHPVSESERGAECKVSDGDATGGTDSAHWVAGAGAGFDVDRLRFVTNGPGLDYSTAKIVSVNSQVFCLTCHKAHGSAHPASLVWEPPDGDVGPSGCDQCHNKSG